MATRVLDQQSCIAILTDDLTLQINKSQIRTIDTVGADTVRIDIGEGALKNIYVTHSTVTEPNGLADVFALREHIKTMLDTWPGAGGGGGGDSMAGFSTADNQQQELTTLSDIREIMANIKMLMEEPGDNSNASRIDESVPNMVYKGYATVGQGSHNAVWAIQRIVRVGDVYHYEWADGNKHFDNIWDDRHELYYLPML